jgi:hypothetical protein
MARPGRRGDKGRVAEIHLPEGNFLETARLSPQALERMVESILGSQSGRGIDRVVIKGGRLRQTPTGPAMWMKSVWKRGC